MSSRTYAFLLSSIAGISTLLGFIFIYIKNDRDNVISKSLGFASGIMITISIIDLIPNSFLLIITNFSKIYTLILIIIGFLLGILLSGIVDQKVEKVSKNSKKLYKLGIITMLVIIMHNIPEGCVQYVSH